MLHNAQLESQMDYDYDPWAQDEEALDLSIQLPTQDKSKREATVIHEHNDEEQEFETTDTHSEGHTYLQRFPDYGWKHNNDEHDPDFNICISDTYFNAKLHNTTAINSRTFDKLKDDQICEWRLDVTARVV